MFMLKHTNVQKELFAKSHLQFYHLGINTSNALVSNLAVLNTYMHMCN